MLLAGHEKTRLFPTFVLSGDEMNDQTIRNDGAVAARPLRHKAIAYAIIGVALSLLTAGSSACQVFEAPLPESTPVPSAPMNAAAPPQQMVVCLDRSTSYRFTAEALQAVSGLIPHLVKPGGGWTVHVRWVQENSFMPEAHVATIAIPAITSAPAAPPTPLPEDNPFARREKERRQKDWEQQQVKHYLAVVAYQQDIAKSRAQVQEQADRLKGLAWEPALGSDIWGCIEKASELMAPSEGRWLLIASDLEEFGPQQKAAPSLSGARVHIIFFQVDEAARAVHVQTAWRQWLGEAGAVEVEFHDPVEGVRPLLRELGGP